MPCVAGPSALHTEPGRSGVDAGHHPLPFAVRLTSAESRPDHRAFNDPVATDQRRCTHSDDEVGTHSCRTPHRTAVLALDKGPLRYHEGRWNRISGDYDDRDFDRRDSGRRDADRRDFDPDDEGDDD